ncbi:Ubx5 protein [Martiniozyma asiatica (nom. inval.)]|nr:Ubx5 protein [Martiniozyma asiatica]
MDEQLSMFMSITSNEDPLVAQNFLEMAGGNLEMAVSLFFEHGGSSIASNLPTTDNRAAETDSRNPTATGTANSDVDNNFIDDDLETDEQMAQRLQNEMYSSSNQQEQIRAPIQPTYETLVDYDYGHGRGSGFFHQERSIFGQNERGIFNQTDENGIIQLDSDEDDDSDEDGNGNGYDEPSSTQRRLANLFRPPFDLITKCDLDAARSIAKEENKWLLVNIQDVTDFRCQVLNRDLWSNSTVKATVRSRFTMLQFHHDSPAGENYINFYPISEYPHVAILDPITGERLHFWEGDPNKFKVVNWLNDVDNWIKGNGRPMGEDNLQSGISKDDPIDVDSDFESDEEFYAAEGENVEDSLDGAHDNKVEVLEPQEAQAEPPKTYSDIINSLTPLTEPTQSDGKPTRIQIRSYSGQRQVISLPMSTSIEEVFQLAKGLFDESAFRLKLQGKDLWDLRDQNVQESGVAGSSLVLEKAGNDDEEEESESENE